MKYTKILFSVLFAMAVVKADAQITMLQDYTNTSSATIGSFMGLTFREAGFSGIYPVPGTNGKEFWICSDRGVNVDCANANPTGCKPTYDKMYGFPAYSPKIHRVRIQGNSLQILQTISIKRPDGSGATGIINPTGLGSTATEVASTDTVLDCANFNNKTVAKDTFGIDCEGIVVDKNGFFWLCEEGGPTVWKLNQNGVVVQRFTPYFNLPGVQPVDAAIDTCFKYRKNNRGFESIAIAPNGKIYVIIQSPLLYPTNAVGENTRVHRMLEIDPATNAMRMLVYLNDGIIGSSGANQIRLRDWKIGDMAAINDSTFLVLEAAARGTTDIKRMYMININGATTVHSGNYGAGSLEALVDSAGLAANGVVAVRKTLVMDLLANSWPSALDKAEGVAIINDSTIAICNDNDYAQTCPNADGIPVATSNESHIITYQLSGANKLAAYKAAQVNVDFGTTGPNSGQSPYLIPAAPGVKFTSILTAGDSVAGYGMAGTPDGLGIYDNNNGTFTMLVNHEFVPAAGVVHAHGAKGAFISKWTINKSDLSVISGSDLIQNVQLYNTGAGTYTLFAPADTTSRKAFNRFCSADLPAVSAFYNAATGLGTQERIFMNGEESGNEGRAFAHVATGANAGTTWELPALGKFSWENAVASYSPQDKTIVAGLDDSTPGQVYIYIGNKTNAGSEIEKAGLTNGKLYGVAVQGLTTEVNGSFPAANTPFTLVDLGNVKDSTGSSIQNRSVALGVTNFLRPEDGAWDPGNPNDFYFATTNAITSPSRLWKLHFDNINTPEAGGSITAVLDGTEGPKMMDNITIDNYGHILIVEDVGGNAHLGKTWQYTIATDQLTMIASHDSTRFINGGANFLTQDEEASGVIDAEKILGPGMFLIVDQAHYAQPGGLVEGGQLLAMFNPATKNAFLGAAPSSSQSPYLIPAAPGVKFTSILTAGDSVAGYGMAGTPDGLGIYDNNNGTFTMLVNHEFVPAAGVVHAHGAKGAFISKWTINKSDLSVISGSDLIQNVQLYNTGAGTYTLFAPADTTSRKAFNRFCSADLPAVSAFYNAATGLGTQERIFMNGEESGNEGRAFAHVATGANAGTTWELPALGKFSWENAVASYSPQDKTIVAGLDDSTPGQVYIYIGNKTNAGSEIEKAGLTNGKLYGVAVQGLTTEVNGSFPAANTPFTLVDLGNVKDSTGSSIQNRSVALGVTNFLRPEDGAWDPGNPNDFYFATTNAITSPSRLWKLHFDNINTPEAGGNITAVLDGTEGPKMMDNITIDNYGHILIVEDVGGNAHLGKTWQYTIATDQLKLIGSHDSTRFLNGGVNFLTQDEEASGVIDAEPVLGKGNFLIVDQAHYAQPGGLVEGGQLLKLFNPDTYKGKSLSTVASARAASATDTVKVRGIITRAHGRLLYIQDATAGIAVFQSSGAMFDSIASGWLKPGDSIEVTGSRVNFSNLQEISLSNGAYSEFSMVTRLATGLPLPEPVTLTVKQMNQGGEQYESRLIKIVNLKAAATGNFAAATNYTVWDGATTGDTIVLRTPSASDTELENAPALAIPKGLFTYIGVPGQFCSSPATGCTTGYQLQGIIKSTDIIPQLTAVNLLDPANNYRIVTSSANTTPVGFRWSSSANATSYKWFLTPQAGTFTTPWVMTPAASDTFVSYTISQFDTLAGTHGIAKGDSVLVKWTAYAYLGTDSMMAAQTHNLWIVREVADLNLTPFDLVAPANNTRFVAEQNGTAPLKATWTKSQHATQYKHFITTLSGSFGAPISVLMSDLAGTDSSLSLVSGALYNLVAGLNVAKGDSVELKWTVFAYKNTADSLKASQDFIIRVIRKRNLNAFSLLTPADNSRLEVESGDNTPVVITWQASATGATYKWLLDEQAGNFANPWSVMNADNSGSNTSLTLTSGAIDNLLSSKSVADGDSVNLKWTVRAYETGDSIQATQTFNIRLVRKLNTGLNDLSLSKAVRIFPNPTSGNTTLQFENREQGAVSISISDMHGREMIVPIYVNDSTLHTELPTADFANGIYFVKISSGNRSANFKLLVIH
jgi:secreted PhoX family phosphatase